MTGGYLDITKEFASLVESQDEAGMQRVDITLCRNETSLVKHLLDSKTSNARSLQASYLKSVFEVDRRVLLVQDCKTVNHIALLFLFCAYDSV